MKYKVQRIKTIAEGFSSKLTAQEWAETNVGEDEDTTFRIRKD